MTPELAAACKDAVHVIRADGCVLRAGRASLYILAGLGWRHSYAVFSRRPWIWLVDLAYRVVADNRSFFSRLLFRD